MAELLGSKGCDQWHDVQPEVSHQQREDAMTILYLFTSSKYYSNYVQYLTHPQSKINSELDPKASWRNSDNHFVIFVTYGNTTKVSLNKQHRETLGIHTTTAPPFSTAPHS